MTEKKNTLRLIGAQSLLILIAVVGFGYLTRAYLSHIYLDRTENHMRDLIADTQQKFEKRVEEEKIKNPTFQFPSQLQEARNWINLNNEDWCRKVAQIKRFRLTLISSVDGNVYCDTVYDVAGMKPLLERPEVQSALNHPSAKGGAVRFSPTHSENTLYATQWIKPYPVIVRAGTQLPELSQAIELFDRALLLFALGLIFLLSLMVVWSTHRLVLPWAKKEIRTTEKKMREDFVATVSHELQTPLTSIYGFASTLADDVAHQRPIQPRFVQIILEDSRRLIRLVSDLLDSSSLDSGMIPVTPEWTSLPQLSETVSELLAPIFQKKEQTLLFSIHTPAIYADPDRLKQVLINLLENAFKYSPPQSEIRCDWRLRFNEGASLAHIILTLEDSGPALSEEEKIRIFEPFYRSPDQRKNQAGTGMGLAIVKKICDLHQATIRIESKKETGTRWIIEFPVPLPLPTLAAQ